ncbi:non-ribosomal peptide synthetase [Pseudomonas anguilliseptica]|uniref:Amino acid adenylation domain-containing protein n=1 Tax=Pseudomonas anguilliseptica TaxID=53406 RepID=A0A1H5LN05_PSEAG|nr:non-ribosomal peptide synthetase [Pseudomonas anguilliseptica]SED57189.1 amino acid adenylation domain-containing protein [Pseudomonas anguilliseptica]SEE78422.1 amino acid adenylation domain-containing protein [Pseudomonas anguilliseptica]
MNELDSALLALLLEDEASQVDRISLLLSAGPSPLSFAQQRLWFLQRLAPESTAYNLTRAFHLSGRLDVLALEKAFQALIARHAVLRTRFEDIQGEPQQIALAEVSFSLACEQHTGMSDEAQLAVLSRRLQDEAAQTFDLNLAPLLRVTLLHFDEQNHGLLLAMHHIVSDAWSNPILVRDLAAAYAQALAGQTPELPVLPVQYPDYAVWQRQQLQGEALATELRHWRQYLGERVPVLELPTDLPRPAQPSQRGQRLRFALPSELSERAQRFCRAESCTPFVLLLATWQVLLARYSGQQAFAIGVPHAARSRCELEELIGFFVNTLVYRVDLGTQLSGRELCRRLRQESLAALDHAELPFELLLEQLQIERDPSRTPLFQAMFNLSSGAAVCLSLADIQIEQLRIDADSAKFDLSLDVAVRPDGVHCELEYNLDLFLPATAERIAAHYQQLLNALLDSPDSSVWQLPLLASGERELVLRQWNRSERLLNPGEDMLALFERRVLVAPGRCALVCGTEQLSYAELNARANRLAHWLREKGVGGEQLIGVCLEREAALLVALLAIHKAGAAYLPIDPAQPPARNVDILAQAAPRLLLTREALAGLFDNGSPVVTLESLEPTLATRSEANPGLLAQPRQLAYSLYTSGSTGRPKGVQIEREALANFLQGIQAHARLTANDRLLAVTTLGFDIAALELFLPLLHGACVVLAQREHTLQPAALIELLETQAISVMQATPATWQMLLDHDSPAWQGLRVLCGGEALAGELAERLLARGVRLSNVYGPTETTVWSAAQKVERVDAAVVPIGRPLANNRLYILDEYLQPQPPGVVGELYIGGAGLARGYAGRADLTAAAFVPNPFAVTGAPGAGPGSRLYRTGDLARYRADGSVEFLGRRDFQVKLRGFRIELGEIEAALNAHGEVQQAVVAVRKAPGGQDALVAYLRAAPELLSESLGPYLRERLPAYMLPAAFVRLESLPLNANGKVDRQALPAPVWGAAEATMPPASDSEKRLAAIWTEVLGVSAISRQDELFALGAQSLQLVRIQARIAREFACEVALAELFAHPRLSDMALLIEQACLTPEEDQWAQIDSLLQAYE